MDGAPGIDLDAYFERIGYRGGRRPSLETLQALHLQHAQTIPFENLSPLLGLPVPLDLPALEQKLVRSGRGGYCFEQNLLFSGVLGRLGFDITGLLARVLWSYPESHRTPRTHMVLQVRLGGRPYIADVGFGGLTLTAPLRLEADSVQETPHERFRLVESSGEWTLQTSIRGEWKPLYRFDLTPQHQPDYEVCNWYTATHPRSRFVTGLLAGRPDADCRYALLNNEFAVHHRDGRTERRTLAAAEELRDVLTAAFRITLPEGAELDAALARVAARQAAS
jgi:N-hydroxyarylamine O-acetyltransferase